MSDPLFCDYNECNTDVHDYARLLERPARGHVLWEPSRVGQVGDCGQIRDGQFWKFFNVYENPPPGCPCLPRLVEEDDLRVTDVDNQHVLRSAQSLSVSFHGGLPLTIPSSVSINGTFSWDRSEFAFLAFGGRTRSRKTVSPSSLEDLKRYLLAHEKKIRIATGVHAGDIVILHGVTRAVAWMGGVARRTSFEVNGSVSVDMGAFSVDWGISAARNRGASTNFPLSSDAACAITRGPAGWDGLDDGERFTVAVQPVLVKRRMKMRRMLGLIRVGRWRQEGPSESPYCEPFKKRTGLLGQAGSNTIEGTQSPGTEKEIDNYSNGSSDSTSDGWETDGDALSDILEEVLNRNPALEAVVGSWDIISNFVSAYGRIPSVAEVGAQLRIDASDTDVAFVVALVPHVAQSQRRCLTSHDASSPSVTPPSGLMHREQFWQSAPDISGDARSETPYQGTDSLDIGQPAVGVALEMDLGPGTSSVSPSRPPSRGTSDIARDDDNNGELSSDTLLFGICGKRKTHFQSFMGFCSVLFYPFRSVVSAFGYVLLPPIRALHHRLLRTLTGLPDLVQVRTPRQLPNISGIAAICGGSFAGLFASPLACSLRAPSRGPTGMAQMWLNMRSRTHKNSPKRDRGMIFMAHQTAVIDICPIRRPLSLQHTFEHPASIADDPRSRHLKSAHGRRQQRIPIGGRES